LFPKNAKRKTHILNKRMLSPFSLPPFARSLVRAHKPTVRTPSPRLDYRIASSVQRWCHRTDPQTSATLRNRARLTKPRVQSSRVYRHLRTRFAML
jgi:hypothetical protein